MRSLVLEDFGRLTLHHEEEPHPPAGCVAVAVAYSGICGTDIHGYTGSNGRRRSGQVMGHEASGVVLSTAADVVGVSIGDRVVINPLVGCGACGACLRGQAQQCPDQSVIGVTPSSPGAYADVVIVPAGNLVALPAALSLRLAALVEPLAVAVHAIELGRPQRGEVVAVLGGGPIGQSVVLALSVLEPQARVLISEPNADRRRLCTDLGALPFDPGSTGAGAPTDLVIDAVGHPATYAAALSTTRRGSRTVVIGLHSQQVTIDAFALTTGERSLHGSYCYTPTDLRRAVDVLTTRPQQAATLVSTVVSPEESAATFDWLASPAPPAGKVLICFTDTNEPVAAHR
ncbi:zinc-dependent alcohol dehydrogenase [Pseudactinotalea suaedae]|uniref:zinc-dependent alcohol dehydrogenase n=1 Tax=Pseudactinotalea suaedae TaxID=1524924 RepID=UPI001391F0AA|nr:alcohol dehydrogenase catalytic domain-containing protein [Pseudactinotalea suaedae]